MGERQSSATPASMLRPVAMLGRGAQPTRPQEAPGGWETRLYLGVRLPGVPHEARASLASALGAVGAESEYFLRLVAGFATARAHNHLLGQTFLRQLEAAALRLVGVATMLEVAAQGYRAALAASHHDLCTPGGAWQPAAEPWWPPFAGGGAPHEALELVLRRCGFAYRHTASVYLGEHVEAVAIELATTLHALNTLPPAGVLPARSLYQGLDELTSALQGDVVPRHIRDVSPDYPGILTGIRRLHQLDAADDRSLVADLAWVRTQLASARAAEAQLRPLVAGSDSQYTGPAGAWRWAAVACEQWQEALAALMQLRA